ncbi:MAG: DUF3788 family protein [Fermentimonas sp.]|jgi:hypothetical protein|nr:DUF3788 family protein [Fermentimonas sp.]NLC85478.1 DUF3788 family protein [Bacteroidales bacterium]MDD2932032.1 DUF3788 family protein [Fermentimonas sp.]MDD3189260.1 DUF3788 family protein [Fermentimonas sp.]MDD3511808.1 DUF3788 family protein [Fermentimonas sp.]
MKQQEETMLLRDADVEPTDRVLEDILGKDIYKVYKALIDIITAKYKLAYEWRFYKDGNAWLCKVSNKKKTVFWLSIWEKFIKTGFYFTEKTRVGINEIPIDNDIKNKFDDAIAIGKLFPLSLDIKKTDELKDFEEIVKYKLKVL